MFGWMKQPVGGMDAIHAGVRQTSDFDGAVRRQIQCAHLLHLNISVHMSARIIRNDRCKAM
ncbi:hypothetical protein [Bifidobacterium castoris]|uniref:hypothetical protein n=1 Tax=Bifidobacterium castoris TaxID=2306972 RepID=UPI0013DDB204|nr:hypothetical protein [Bifidobacterium castoris]